MSLERNTDIAKNTNFFGGYSILRESHSGLRVKNWAISISVVIEDTLQSSPHPDLALISARSNRGHS